MKTRTVISKSPEETRTFAASLLKKLEKGAVLALHGELGSGKTCFVQGLASALGVKQPVTSPTFTMINEYLSSAKQDLSSAKQDAGRQPLYHIDLYRVRGPGDLMSLGLEDYLEPDGITVIEWAERAEDMLPEEAIHIYFETLPDPNARSITIMEPKADNILT